MGSKIYGHSGGTATSHATVFTKRYIVGPPAHGGNAQGIYVIQTSGATPEYRWIEDQPLPAGQVAPTTYTDGSY